MLRLERRKVCTRKRLTLLGDREVLVDREYQWQWWVMFCNEPWCKVEDEQEGLKLIAKILVESEK